MQQNPPNLTASAAATANSTYTYNDYANWYKYYYGNYYGTVPHSGYAAQPAYPTGYPVQPQAPQSYAVPPPPGTEDQFRQASAGNVASTIAAPAKPALQQSLQQPTTAPSIMKAHIGHKRPGLGSTGGPSTKKSKNKIPVPPVKCTICDITVSSEQVYITHVNGKSHKKKAASLLNLATQDASAMTTNPGSNQSPSKKKSPKKNQKKAGKAGKAMDPTHQTLEQVVYQCDLCSVTVNSQQQLDLHLTGAKHKKTMNRLSKSNDPEILAKLSKMKDQVQKLTHLKASPGKIQPVTISNAPPDPPGTEGEEQNLPSGYVFVPASQSETGKDTYLCSICRHQSTDLFTLNVHVNSNEHKHKVSEQEKPLEINQEAIDERLNLVPQEKAVSSKTNFDLRVHQTSNASTWKPNAKTFTKRMLPLSASFVSGEVLK